MTDSVRIVEVGPRDGLQNEKNAIDLESKIALINKLSSAGISHIEAGSFVSPKWVPQMASSDQVLLSIDRKKGCKYTALTPNLRGFEAALVAKADEVAVFTAASESFVNKNINCSIKESIQRFVPIIDAAKAQAIPVRAYVSCIVECPYEGKVSATRVIEVCEQLLKIGCYEVSLGDTVGRGGPQSIKKLFHQLRNNFSLEQLACHFHDTYGQALANQFAALELGYRTFDTSVAGLGGCPYAPGASGNVSTEDTIYMLEDAGLFTGINLNQVIEAGEAICKTLKRPNLSKVALASRVKNIGE